MIFVEASEANYLSTRLIGNNINVLLTEAMKYVTVCRDFYKIEIRKALENGRVGVVSHFSCPFPNGLFIYYDPNNEITEEEANNMFHQDLEKKCAKSQQSAIN